MVYKLTIAELLQQMLDVIEEIFPSANIARDNCAQACYSLNVTNCNYNFVCASINAYILSSVYCNCLFSALCTVDYTYIEYVIVCNIYSTVGSHYIYN